MIDIPPRVADARGAGLAVSYVMLIAAAAVFGLMPTLNRLAVDLQVPPVAFPFWYSMGAALLSLVACAAARVWPRFTAAHLRIYGVMGGVGMAAPFVLLTSAAPHVPASVITLIIALTPGFTYLFALPFGLDRLHWIRIVGLGFGFAGVIVLVAPSGDEMAGDPTWLLAALLGPVMFGIANVFAARFWPPESPSLTLAFGQMVAGSLVLAPFVLLSDVPFVPTVPFGPAERVIAAAALVMATLIVLFYEIVRRQGPVFFAQFTYLNVVTGVFWAVLILREAVTAALFGALALMMVGIALVNRKIPSR